MGIAEWLVQAPIAWAQAITPPPNIACSGLVGCGGVEDNIVEAGLPVVLKWTLNIATAICLLMIMWWGFSMVIAMGDEGKVEKGRMNVLYALIGLVLVISAQVIVAAVGTLDLTVADGATPLAIVGIIFATITGSLRTLLNVAFTLMLVIAGIRMVYARGKSEEFEKGKHMIIGVIIGALIVNLATVLIRALLDIFNIT
jgi:hypothetical protein